MSKLIAHYAGGIGGKVEQSYSSSSFGAGERHMGRQC